MPTSTQGYAIRPRKADVGIGPYRRIIYFSFQAKSFRNSSFSRASSVVSLVM